MPTKKTRKRPTRGHDELRAALRQKLKEALEIAERLGIRANTRSVSVQERTDTLTGVMTVRREGRRERHCWAQEECARDIEIVLRDAFSTTGRLTTTGILLEFGRRNMDHSDQTVRRTLAALVKRGTLHVRRKCPRGYTLTELLPQQQTLFQAAERA